VLNILGAYPENGSPEKEVCSLAREKKGLELRFPEDVAGTPDLKLKKACIVQTEQ
jgi:hypothetical protein